MKTFDEYLNHSRSYIGGILVGKTFLDEKAFIKNIVNRYSLESDFISRVEEDTKWQELADNEVFFFIDVVKTSPYSSATVEPFLEIIKPEFGSKAVFKLVIDRKLFDKLRHSH